MYMQFKINLKKNKYCFKLLIYYIIFSINLKIFILYLKYKKIKFSFSILLLL
jgi:hypothetical protein